jgi:hypothetical protein
VSSMSRDARAAVVSEIRACSRLSGTCSRTRSSFAIPATA